MNRSNAYTAKELSLSAKQAVMAELVADGKLSQKQADLIDFRKPHQKALECAKNLEGTARECLIRKGRITA